MIITCPQCHSQYNLDAAKLGAGRDVRCVSCNNTWFQEPREEAPAAPPAAAAEPEPVAAASETPVPDEKPAGSVTEALNSILEKDDAAFDAVLADVAKNVGKASAAAEEKKTAAPAEAVEVAETKRPVDEKKAVVRAEPPPVVTYNPMGMGAATFGAMVFLFLAFLTLTPLFVMKEAIVHTWPQMSLLYRTMGFEVRAPGEGIRISEVTAEKRIDSKNRVLVVEGKMTNTTEHTIAYPPLRVVMKNEGGKVAKEWDLKTGFANIASGDVVPLMVQLEGVPEEGTSVELRVKEE